MPFWPCQYTGGVLPTGAIFCPCGDNSHTGPTFSVTSILPSGRKAIRQGSSKVVTGVIVKGRLVSDFCSPLFTWAPTIADASMKRTAVFATLIVISPCLSLWSLSSRHRNRHSLARATFCDPDRVARGLHGRRCVQPFLDDRDAGLVAIDGDHGNLSAPVLGHEQLAIGRAHAVWRFHRLIHPDIHWLP